MTTVPCATCGGVCPVCDDQPDDYHEFSVWPHEHADPALRVVCEHTPRIGLHLDADTWAALVAGLERSGLTIREAEHGCEHGRCPDCS